MEVHKPKPFHGWREFLKEYGIIVLGVLTALAGEQAVEEIHYRGEVREARAALKAEVEEDLAAYDYRYKLDPCITARLSDLDRWARSQNGKHPLRLNRPIEEPTILGTGTSVWRIATGSVVARMPLDDRINYASFYDDVDGIKSNQAGANDLWIDLMRIANKKSLDAERIDQILDDVRQLQAVDKLIVSDIRESLARDAARLKAGPAPVPFAIEVEKWRADFCRPIIAG